MEETGIGCQTEKTKRKDEGHGLLKYYKNALKNLNISDGTEWFILIFDP